MPRKGGGRRGGNRRSAHRAHGGHSHRHHVGHVRHAVGHRHTISRRRWGLGHFRTGLHGRRRFGFGLRRGPFSFGFFHRIGFRRRRRTVWRRGVIRAPVYPGITSYYGPYYGAKNLPPSDLEEAQRQIEEYRHRLLCAYEGTHTIVYRTTVAWSTETPYSQDGLGATALHTVRENQQSSLGGSQGALSQVKAGHQGNHESEGYERRALYMDSYSSGRPSSDAMTYNRQGPSKGRDKGRSDPGKDEKLGCCVVS